MLSVCVCGGEREENERERKRVGGRERERKREILEDSGGLEGAFLEDFKVECHGYGWTPLPLTLDYRVL